jgi:hypothetical protein
MRGMFVIFLHAQSTPPHPNLSMKNKRKQAFIYGFLSLGDAQQKYQRADSTTNRNT